MTGDSRRGARFRTLSRAAALLAAGCLSGALLQYREHRAARRFLRAAAVDAAAKAGATDVRSKVVALRDHVRATVSFHGVPQSGRPFLRDSADQTLRSGRGWCGEASRAFICLAKELDIAAQRLNLSGAEKHTVAEARLSDGVIVVVDAQSPPTIVDLEPLDRVMLRSAYSDYYSINLERLGLRPLISRIRFEPGYLTYWIENPRLIKAAALLLSGLLLSGVSLLSTLASRRAQADGQSLRRDS